MALAHSLLIAIDVFPAVLELGWAPLTRQAMESLPKAHVLKACNTHICLQYSIYGENRYATLRSCDTRLVTVTAHCQPCRTGMRGGLHRHLSQVEGL